MTIQLMSDPELRGIINWAARVGVNREVATEVVRRLACANRAAWINAQRDGAGHASYIGPPLQNSMVQDSVSTVKAAGDYIGRLLMNCSAIPDFDMLSDSFAPPADRAIVVEWLRSATEVDRLELEKSMLSPGSPGGSL